MITVSLGKIDSKRVKLNITIKDLAKSIGQGESTISKFLKHGKQLSKDLNTIDKLCKKLGMTWHEVIR